MRNQIVMSMHALLCAVVLSACAESSSHAPDDASVDHDATLQDAGHHPVQPDAGDAGVDPQADGGAGSGGNGSITVTEEDGLRVVTITTAEFTIEPLDERYVCQNFANPLGEDVAIVRSSSSMTAGSHHMFAFQQDVGSTPVGQLADCSGLEFGSSAHSAQGPERTIEYPEGVARAWAAEQGIRVQAHYLKVDAAPIVARVIVKLYTTPQTNQILSSSLFFNNLGIDVGPHETGSAERTCTLPQDIELMNTNSHMHSFATHFVATLNDGTVLYETDDWSDPTPRTFDPPLHLEAGTQITYRCEYNNTSDIALSFGESARSNEMCIFTGQFFPAPNGGITCM